MQNIQMSYNGIQVTANLHKGVTILYDFSGTGKTFLFQTLKYYMIENNCKFSYIDYSCINLKTEEIKARLSNADYLFLDNADLYMTKELWDWLFTLPCCVLICMKDIANLHSYMVNLARVHYDGKVLQLRYQK